MAASVVPPPGRAAAGPTVAWATPVAIGLALLACLAGWLTFWDLGRVGLTSHDWPKEALYLDTIRDAIRAGSLPFYTDKDAQGTSWFLAIPEVPTSPQLLLLPLLTNAQFVTLNCLLMWAVGVWGCLLNRAEHSIATLPFLLALLLFSLNGHIVAHLAVGHSMWVGYFLSPFVVLHASRMAEGDASARTALLLGLTLAAMMHLGAFHLAVYFAMLAGVLALLAPARLLRPVALALVACGVLAAARVVPAFAAFAHADRTFMSGYPGLGTLLDALATVRRPDAPLLGSFTPEPVRWWEYDLYVGPAGLLFLGLFGLGHWLKERAHPARLLAWASLLLLAVSFGDGLYLMSLAGAPVLGQERVGARVAVAPLVCLIFLAARGCTREGPRRPGLDAALLVALVLTAGSLLTHLLVWRITGLEAAPWDVWQLHLLPVERSAGYERLTLAAWALTAAAWAGALAYLARGRPRAV